MASRNEKFVIIGDANRVFDTMLQVLKENSFLIEGNLDSSKRKIVATAKTTWASWGENILVDIIPLGENEEVEVSLTSSLKFGLIDWGKNTKNIKKIIEDFKTFWKKD